MHLRTLSCGLGGGEHRNTNCMKNKSVHNSHLLKPLAVILNTACKVNIIVLTVFTLKCRRPSHERFARKNHITYVANLWPKKGENIIILHQAHENSRKEYKKTYSLDKILSNFSKKVKNYTRRVTLKHPLTTLELWHRAVKIMQNSVPIFRLSDITLLETSWMPVNIE